MQNAAVALAVSLALMSAPEVGASADTNSAVTVLHRSDSGQPRYVRFEGIAVPGAGVLNKSATAAQAEQLKQFIAPIQGLDDNASRALGVARTDTLRNGATRYSWQQAFDGIPVLHGKLTALVDAAAQLRVVSGEPATQAPVRKHRVSAVQAARLLGNATDAIGAVLPTALNWRNTDGMLHWQDSGSSNVREVWAQPSYARQGSSLVPAWRYEIRVAENRASELWEVVVSDSGEPLSQRSLTRDASFSYRVYARTDNENRPIDSPYGDLTPLPSGLLTPGYIAANTLVIEELAANHNNPWLPADATTLSGNHAEAYLDISGADGFDAADRRGPISAARQFHWTFDGAADVRSSTSNQNAAMTQAFYVVNWLHDYFYDAGFTTGIATGNNRMLVEIQDSSDTNNANMSVPEFASPRMQVFLFDGPTTHSAQISGGLTATYTTGYASFGPDAFDVSGELVLMQDAGGVSSTDGCETLTNAAALSGKIALVDRGNCNFIDKVYRAEQAGASAVLVANNTTGTLTMGKPDGNTTEVTIGALVVSQADGDAIKSALTGATVNARLQRTTATPIDGALDSALVAHEWGHYLSNRLIDIGTVNQANGMDEGWADFVALFALSAIGDAGNTDGSYGFSGYTVNDFANGLRRFPYSRDLTINPLSFRHISNGVMLPDGRAGSNNNEVHNTGEIWASALWDAYVNLIDARGYATAQQRMREYLVEGMKNTPAGPDFVQARDAQLDAVAALQANETPSDLELFRAAFARRGLGINAVTPAKADDNQTAAIESFVWVSTQVPSANAGPDRTVNQAELVDLQGTGTDADGAIVAYQWRQLSGPDVTLAGAETDRVSFTAPSGCASSPMLFELTVTDNDAERASDQVTVTTLAADNLAPAVDAGANQTVNERSAVTLQGTANDSDGSITAYRWQQLSGPSVVLQNAASATSQFDAPAVSSTTTLEFQLTATDDRCTSTSDTISITINNTDVSSNGGSNGGGGGGGGGSWHVLLLALMTSLLRYRRPQQP